MNDRLRKGRWLMALGAVLPSLVYAGFGFGFDSDNGFYDYDPEHYPWGYPPPAYRGYNPRWYWGTRDEPSTWRFGSRPRPKTREDKGKGWDRSWSFGDWGDDNTSRFSFGPQRFHFGDRWTPSFGDRWGRGRYRYPYPPYPAWGWAPPGPRYAPPGWRPYPVPPPRGVKSGDAPTAPAKASSQPPASDDGRKPSAGEKPVKPAAKDATSALPDGDAEPAAGGKQG